MEASRGKAIYQGYDIKSSVEYLNQGRQGLLGYGKVCFKTSLWAFTPSFVDQRFDHWGQIVRFNKQDYIIIVLDLMVGIISLMGEILNQHFELVTRNRLIGNQFMFVACETCGMWVTGLNLS